MDPAASTASIADGLVLSYVEQGGPGAVATVFLPGPTDSWLSYQPVLGLMPSSLRAVAVSQRGHGDSAKPRRGYGVEDFAADVPSFLDALGVRTAVLVGHSGSCLTARRVAIDHPERVAGLVLEASPSTLVGNAELSTFVDSVVSQLEDPIDPHLAESFVLDTSSSDLPRGVVDALAREAVKVPARVWQEMFTALVRYDDRSELGRVRAPTLLIWGADDPLVDFDDQRDLLGRMPSARLITYDRVGHTPRWEDPSRFASDVAAFVALVGAAG